MREFQLEDKLIEAYGRVFQWVDALSQRECIVCFNSTEMEDEVLKALVVNKVPTILVVMNRFRYVHNIQIERALMDEPLTLMPAEKDNRGQRWTVGEDKVLLRMFYEN